ncbi:MAG: mechanosensitive ion channel, partial [Dokdonella sp.]|nr:mechanosensitive ion channel [Dokdonella sp.]
LGLQQHTLDQWSVLGTGALRVAALMLGVLAVLAPLGADPSELVGKIVARGGVLSIGSLSLTPAMVLGAALVLVVGIALVRGVQRWLRGTYLPTTRLDAAMRESITTLLGWLGIVLAVSAALATLGLGLERVAWIASALSVGIGFGLQAIVQNFVSGLILLVERPVKVGDWVVLGDIEGDIRRINVRATEIQLGDRSTVIVPNSELITKSVRNVTQANAEGRVRMLLPLPLASDAERVRGIALAALAAHPEVLVRPPPSVLLDGISQGNLVFALAAYVADPRRVAVVRSELLLTILAQLGEAGVALSTPLQVTAAPGAGG